jgi:hypothetical protein
MYLSLLYVLLQSDITFMHTIKSPSQCLVNLGVARDGRLLERISDAMSLADADAINSKCESVADGLPCTRLVALYASDHRVYRLTHPGP